MQHKITQELQVEIQNRQAALNHLQSQTQSLQQGIDELKKPLDDSGRWVAYYVRKYNVCLDEIKSTRAIREEAVFENDLVSNFNSLKRYVLDCIKSTPPCYVNDTDEQIFNKIQSYFENMYIKIKDIANVNYESASRLKFDIIDPKILQDYNYALVEEYDKKVKEIQERITPITEKIRKINQEIDSLNQEINRLDEIKSKKQPYIDRLDKYISRVKAGKENPDFEANFHTFKTRQGKSQEVNYKTALKLLNELNDPHKTLQDVLSKQNVQENRKQEVVSMQQRYKGLFSKNTLRGELKDIVADAQKLPKMK